ncbi:DUF134 domain-containing protein [Candidatus Woesearchaeota archaeon]|nr:DUF134 domain-containing protein [Candidatus Woesearchaeota archaeon]MBW2994538.1 DUF134 domain-containing protein [Candidatus Woesearchaeota archaeon]
MPRPRLCRRVRFMPGITHFKPAGVRLAKMPEVILSMGEFEALRLCDFEEINQLEAAKKMKISQPTLQRTLASARKKVADALVNGKSIKIEGGSHKMVVPRGSGKGLRRGIDSGLGRGRLGGTAGGPIGECVCPKCNTKVAHIRGTPCAKRKCPKCNSVMARG